MSREQILDSILNRGQARLTLDDLNQSPIREGEHVEVFSHEERLETFLDILLIRLANLRCTKLRLALWF